MNDGTIQGRHVDGRVGNETYDAETETRRSKKRPETFGRDIRDCF